MVEGLVESMEISGSQYGKYFVPNSRRLYCRDGAHAAALSEVHPVKSVSWQAAV